MPRKTRLDPAIFHLPVERMRQGYYSDKYFVRAREILLTDRAFRERIHGLCFFLARDAFRCADRLTRPRLIRANLFFCLWLHASWVLDASVHR